MLILHLDASSAFDYYDCMWFVFIFILVWISVFERPVLSDEEELIPLELDRAGKLHA